MSTDFSGSWRAKLDESRFLSRTPGRLTAEVTQSAEWLHAEMRIFFEGEGESRMVFKAPILAPDEVRAGSVAQARWMGSDLVVETHIATENGDVILRDRWWLSEDGKRLTMAHRDDVLAGQTVVFERQ